MEQFEGIENEHTDDDSSYDMVQWEEFGFSASDQEDPPTEIVPENNETESSDNYSEVESSENDEIDSDNYDEVDPIGFERTAAYRMEDGVRMLEIPAYLKRKEVMEIKDVVKDHVLPFLPAKSLLRFKTVSKDWDRWISSPLLAHKQSYLFRDISGYFCQLSNNSNPTFMPVDENAYGIPSPSLKFLPEPVVIRSSCNGLLLCQGLDGDKVYYVCNPANKEWTSLPQPNYYHQSEPAIVLAFEPSELNIATHFEVICAIPLIDVPIIYFEIYSSEERSWRCSATNCIELEHSELKGGFYMKRMAYWEISSGNMSGNILAFDLKNELCGTLPCPANTAPGGVLTQMRGELCYIKAHYYRRNAYLNIYGGVDMSLVHKVTVGVENEHGLVCRVLPSVDSSEVVMILVGFVVYAYHLRDQTVEVISRRGNSRTKYFPYLNSLVYVAPK